MVTTAYDPSYLSGFGHSPYQWEASGGIQHQLMPNVGLNVAYFRRWYGNFAVTDNLDWAASDFSPYCATAPTDARLSTSGQSICGFSDISAAKRPLVNNQITDAKTFGARTDVYDGLDVNVNARLLKRGLIQGGFNIGSEATNNCFVVDSPQQLHDCEVTPPFQTWFKILASYPLPGSLTVSGAFQSSPRPQIFAAYTVTSAQVLSTLGRNLSGGSAVVDLIAPGTQYEDGLRQLDLRLSRAFRFNERARLRGNVDLYNALNGNAVLALVNTYGANWLRPTEVLKGRLLKFSAQLEF